MIDIEKFENLVGKRIAELRIAKGVSAREMSLSIGQGAAYINNIENNKTLPSIRGLFYICDYLNITPQDFFDFDSTDPKLLNELVSDLKSLSPEMLASLSVIAKGLRR